MPSGLTHFAKSLVVAAALTAVAASVVAPAVAAPMDEVVFDAPTYVVVDKRSAEPAVPADVPLESVVFEEGLLIRMDKPISVAAVDLRLPH